ncbi:MAG: aldo/keto reductase [Parcubacteria group bacterium]|nr:aldo/keto reductase [Parcubacteria group bacterium]
MMKLALGTVQLGLPYGINNKTGKPSRDSAFAILDKAIESGITVFDTASLYGDAEEVLGEFIASRQMEKRVSVVSKMRPLTAEDFVQGVASVMQEEAEKSARRLHVPILDGYLLHDASGMYNPEIIMGLKILKDTGIVKHIGVSIYEEKDALYAASLGSIDYIQIPYNIFDQRLDKTDFFTLTKKNHIKVFARSAFLQGLLLMDIDAIPKHLAGAASYIQKLDVILKEYGFMRQQAALLFSYFNGNIDYVVIGVDTVKQLEEHIHTVTKLKDYEECLRKIKDVFLAMDINKNIISPHVWQNLKK